MKILLVGFSSHIYFVRASESNEEPVAKKQKRNAETKPAQEVLVAAVEAETANISSSDGFNELAVEKVVSKGSSAQEEPPWSVCDRFPCGKSYKKLELTTLI